MKIIKMQFESDEIEFLPIKRNGKKFYVEIHEEIPNGFPSPADDFAGEKLSLDERYLSKPESTYIGKAKGNSNYPTIQEGDIMIIRADLPILNNCMAIVSVNNNKFTAKRIDTKNKKLIPDNKKHPVIEINEDDVIITMGVVKHIIRDL